MVGDKALDEMLEFVIRVRVQPSTFDATTKNTIEAFLVGGHLGAQLAIGSVETLKDAWGTGDDVKAANLLEVFTFASLFQSLSAVEEGAVAEDQVTAWVERMLTMFRGDEEKSDLDKAKDGVVRWWYLRLNEQFKQGSWLTYANLLALTACALCGVPEAHETLTALWRRILKGEITFPVKTLVDELGGPDWQPGAPPAIPAWIDLADALALNTILAGSARAAREYMENTPPQS